MSLGGGKGGGKVLSVKQKRRLPKEPWEWDLLAVEYLDSFDVSKSLPSAKHWNAFLDGWFNGSPASLRGYEFPEIAHAGALARHILANAPKPQLRAILTRQGIGIL